jgi:hypothetical protein
MDYKSAIFRINYRNSLEGCSLGSIVLSQNDILDAKLIFNKPINCHAEPRQPMSANESCIASVVDTAIEMITHA